MYVVLASSRETDSLLKESLGAYEVLLLPKQSVGVNGA